MPQTIREIMTPDPEVLDASSSVAAAAKAMRDRDIGDVLVLRDGTIHGIVTDRDIVVRGVAAGLDPDGTAVGDICTEGVAMLSPDDTVGDAVRLMTDLAVRRLPVCEDGRAVGVVSLGDIAVERDSESALADISDASPNN
jgi:CBS domain-containing protein